AAAVQVARARPALRRSLRPDQRPLPPRLRAL
ncbi:MAG: hypothetical protein AVDCRST_MAG77-139, partial [uncultured Chloroflexi bacterium]